MSHCIALAYVPILCELGLLSSIFRRFPFIASKIARTCHHHLTGCVGVDSEARLKIVFLKEVETHLLCKTPSTPARLFTGFDALLSVWQRGVGGNILL